MKRARISWLQALAILLLTPFLVTGVALGQDFDLGFVVPAELEDDEGVVVPFDASCTLTQSGVDPADPSTRAAGWSLSFGTENCTVLDITTVGTDLEQFFPLGFEVSEVTTGAGNEGAVSAIVINLIAGTTLPENDTYSVAALSMEAAIVCDGTARLFYEDGRQGQGQPVPNNVTQGGQTKVPNLGESSISLKCPPPPPPTCCEGENAELNVGFSATVVRSDTPFDSIENVEEPGADPVCASMGGLIEGPSPLTAYANIVSQTTDPGAQGWSLSIRYEGDLTLVDATTTGVGSLDPYQPLGFDVTEIIDPTKAENAGKEGAVSAVVLGLVVAKNLPAVGTESVLAITLEGENEQEGQLRFEDGLVGQGQPVPNNITLKGASELACNFPTAMVNLKIGGPVLGKFIRGNANDDSKVDIADPIWIINELFRGGPGTLCQDAADANNDEMVDLSDAMLLIDYQFLGGPPPTDPFPGCGAGDEAIDDGLGCEVDQSDC